MTYKISVQAAQDIESIWLYTFENWSAQQADKYINLIFDEIENITKNPNAGKNYNHVKEGYWCVKVTSHLLFYRINTEQNVIEIIRVLHQRMDVESRLNK